MTDKEGVLTDSEKWRRVLSVSAVVSNMFPEAVLVGGTAAAIYADHRLSFDNGHILPALRDNFDSILSHLESLSNWQTARIKAPVRILGSLDGVETGFRQLRREAPLSAETVIIRDVAIRLPTPEELLRVKVFLALTRNATRDYLDVAALYRMLGDERSSTALHSMDALYPQKNNDKTAVRMQIVKQLADPKPFDLDDVDLSAYKGVKAPYNNWSHVRDLNGLLARNFASAITALPEDDLNLDSNADLASQIKVYRDKKEAGDDASITPLPGLK